MKIESRNPNFYSRVQEKFAANAFSHHIGLQLIDIQAGRIEAEIALESYHLQQDSIAHGGTILTLSDVVAGFAAYSVIPELHRVVTAEIKVSFLRPGKAQTLIGIGQVIKAGKNMIFTESDIYAIWNSERTLISRATSIMAVIH